jgi:hypothetical protein
MTLTDLRRANPSESRLWIPVGMGPNNLSKLLVQITEPNQ